MEDCILMPVCFTDKHSFSAQLLYAANSFPVFGGGEAAYPELKSFQKYI